MANGVGDHGPLPQVLEAHPLMQEDLDLTATAAPLFLGSVAATSQQTPPPPPEPAAVAAAASAAASSIAPHIPVATPIVMTHTPSIRN